MPPKPAYRISAIEGVMLGGTAIIADAIQLFFKLFWLTGVLGVLSEAVGWAISGLAGFLLSIGFMTARVPLFQGTRRQVRAIIAILFEGMPFINLVPTFTIWTYLTIRQSRKEDKEKAIHSATIKRREEALRRGGLRRVRRDQGGTETARPMRRMLRNIPHPAFRAAGVMRRVRPSGSRAPEKNAL